jgi:8-oxo-dGTP pyrophosphatase MutT (NUDIX family)
VLEETYARRSARVLVIDAAARVLLLESYHDHRRPELGTFWLVPGGGVDAGEPVVAAAARELVEETGLRVSPQELGEPVAFTSGHAEFSWARGLFRDDFFVHRVTSHEVSTDGWLDYEQRFIIGTRWWSVPELAATTETVYPFGLAGLLTDLLAGRPFPQPSRLPWHH